MTTAASGPGSQPSRRSIHTLRESNAGPPPETCWRQLDSASRQHTARQANTRTTDADTQLRHELNLAFADLGGAAFALAHHAALNDERLAAHVQRIHDLYTQLDAFAHKTPLNPPAHKRNAEHAATA